MDEATAAHILEPFFTTKESGTGLGLPTSAAIVKAHGGELEVQTAPGRGTTIAFELASVAMTDVWVHRPDAPVPGPGRGRRVLVVDDEPAICELVRQTLDQRGFVTEVAQGREALELLTQGRRFDAVLTDVMMPGRPGRRHRPPARRRAAARRGRAHERDAPGARAAGGGRTERRPLPGQAVHPRGAAGDSGCGPRRASDGGWRGDRVTGAHATLLGLLEPALRDAIAAL